jgi:hypothetical protein
LLTRWHKTFGQGLIISLVLLHVAAVAFYFVKKRQNLVRPMISGDKPLPDGVPASADGVWPRSLAMILLAASACGVAWLVSLGA